MLPTTNTGRNGSAAISRARPTPHPASTAADFELLHPNRPTTETTAGPSINPRLPPLATSPFASAPALKCFTAISSRNVVPAVSSTPAATARQRSYRYVIAVRLFVPASKAQQFAALAPNPQQNFNSSFETPPIRGIRQMPLGTPPPFCL